MSSKWTAAYKRKVNRLHTYTLKGRFAYAKREAKKKRRGWSLTLEEYRHLIKQPCAYGGRPLPRMTGAGLDRKNNSQGYHAHNVVPCCERHNTMKRDFFSYAQMIKIVALAPSLRRCGKRKKHSK